MKIESKEKARELGAPSPDRAEALMLALGELQAEYASYPVTYRAPGPTALQRETPQRVPVPIETRSAFGRRRAGRSQ